MATLKNTITDAAMTDTAIILKNYISAGYIISQPPKTSVNFDTKFARMDKYYHIIVENMPEMHNLFILGSSMFRIEDVKRVQIFASRTSAINDRFLMERHILDIINANPLGMSGSGIQQAFITQFTPIITQPDQKTTDGEVEVSGIARSFALVTLQYDLKAV